MRKDFDKILCERPRRGGIKTYKQFRNGKAAFSDAKRESMKKHYGWDKELNENLVPLERYLRSKVGQKWDDIYSEIRKNIDTRKAISLHILQHLEMGMVEHPARGEDGKLYRTLHYRWGESEFKPSPYRDILYTDPDDGTLKLLKKKARPKRPKDTSIVKISDTIEARCFKGNWFICEYKQVPNKTYKKQVHYAWDNAPHWIDEKVGVVDHLTGERRFYPDTYVFSKRSASKKEIKKYKLRG